MHKSRLGTLIIDCQDGDLMEHALFWSGALGLRVTPGKKQVNSKYIALEGGPEDDVRVLLQSVDHESRIHIDIETDDRAAEVTRLENLGAKVVARTERWEVLEAPSGHRFCVIGPIRDNFEGAANRWE